MQAEPLSNEPDAGEMYSGQMRVALLLALCVHGGLLLFAYLSPPIEPPSRRRVITMDVVQQKPLTPPKPPEKPPEPDRPLEEKDPPPRASSRPLPELLQPVARDTKDEPDSPAAVMPRQPEQPPGDRPPPKGPINLFDDHILKGSLGQNGPPPIPKGQNRLLKDERLDEKKEPEFHLVPEKGGGFKYDGNNFIAHIAPDGALSFENRFPIGFQKGQSGFSFDLTDLVSRGAKQDPYFAEKRRFVEHTDKLREELRRKKRDGVLDNAFAALPGELSEIWNSGRPAAVRRRELYERWVECADDKDEAGSTGIRARKIIEEYVRRHLPPGHPLAYTDEELRRFATQREGLPVFNPYRKLPE